MLSWEKGLHFMTQLSYNLVKESRAICCHWTGSFLLSGKACSLLRVHHHHSFSSKLRPWNRKTCIVDLRFSEHFWYMITMLAPFIHGHQIYWWNNHKMFKDDWVVKSNFTSNWNKLKCVTTWIRNRQVWDHKTISLNVQARRKPRRKKAFSCPIC